MSVIANSINFTQIVPRTSTIRASVINANTLDVQVTALDFVNLRDDKYSIVIWHGAVMPPYEDLESGIIHRQPIETSSSSASITVSPTSKSINFYTDIYCIGFLMGDKLTSVSAFSAISGGIEITHFQSALYVLSVSVTQISVGFTTPTNNNPTQNTQYIDIFPDSGPINSSTALSIRGNFSDYASGQTVIRLKDDVPLERGSSYRVLDLATVFRTHFQAAARSFDS